MTTKNTVKTNRFLAVSEEVKGANALIELMLGKNTDAGLSTREMKRRLMEFIDDRDIEDSRIDAAILALPIEHRVGLLRDGDESVSDYPDTSLLIMQNILKQDIDSLIEMSRDREN